MSDEEDDPFAELDDEDDGSDPFAELDDGDATAADDVSEVDGIEREDVSLGGSDAVDGDVEGDPFAELGEAPADEAVFEDLSVEDSEEPPEVPEESPAESMDEPDGEVVVVPKRRYCQSCEHFDAPPEVGCTHPDTEILELVGTDRFKVRNCPVVAQRRSAGMVSEGDIVVVEDDED